MSPGWARRLGGADHVGIDVHAHHGSRVHLPRNLHGERAGAAADVEHRHPRSQEVQQGRVAVGKGARRHDAGRLGRDVRVLVELHAAGSAINVSQGVHDDARAGADDGGRFALLDDGGAGEGAPGPSR